MALLLP
ncbi:hypothetical protein YPPY72_0821, partial [Yersinia pestis PY-72]